MSVGDREEVTRGLGGGGIARVLRSGRESKRRGEGCCSAMSGSEGSGWGRGRGSVGGSGEEGRKVTDWCLSGTEMITRILSLLSYFWPHELSNLILYRGRPI